VRIGKIGPIDAIDIINVAGTSAAGVGAAREVCLCCFGWGVFLRDAEIRK
jgi:hypothetical protein